MWLAPPWAEASWSWTPLSWPRRSTSSRWARLASAAGPAALPARASSAPRTATATAADVPVDEPGGTRQLTVTSTDVPGPKRACSTAAARSLWRSGPLPSFFNGQRLPVIDCVHDPPAAPSSHVATWTSAPGLMAKLTTSPWPAKRVSVQPPRSHTRTGAVARTTRSALISWLWVTSVDGTSNEERELLRVHRARAEPSIYVHLLFKSPVYLFRT